MKKIVMIMIAIGLALGVSAQKIRGGVYHHVRPHVAVGFGFGYAPFYPYYGFGSPWYGAPYAWNYGYSRPSRLELTIQDIKVDYADRIKSVRMEDGLSGRAKRQTIQELKHERDKAIVQAQKDYYYKRSGKNRPADNSNSDSNNNNNDSE